MTSNYPVESYKDKAIIVSKDSFFDSKFLSIPIEYQQYIEKVVLSYGFIVDRIERLAQQILEENNNKDITLVVIMKSALLYSDYLLKFITENKKYKQFGGSVYFEYISSNSYADDKSTGNVQINTSDDVFKKLKGKDVVIVEDMYDSGKSLNHLLNYIKQFELASIKVSSLFVKQNLEHLQYSLHIDYVGFLIPENTFIIGFGMDYNELFRDLNHSCVVSEEGLTLLKKKFNQN